jgi:hypothetical protein
MHAIIDELNNSLYRWEGKCKTDEYKTYKRAVGGVMAEIYILILDELYSLFPEFEPKS